jgi:hypothetical protein
MWKSSILILMIVGIFGEVISQSVQFRIPIKIQSGTLVDTLWLGVRGDGPDSEILDNTYGIDLDQAYGEWSEQPYPPDFPGILYSCKFMDIPNRSELQSGIRPGDFRGYTNSSQVDTFAIRVYGINVAKGSLTLSWPSDLNLHGNAWRLLKKEGEKFRVVVRNMMSRTSYTENNKKHVPQFDFLLIKSGVITKNRK